MNKNNIKFFFILMSIYAPLFILETTLFPKILHKWSICPQISFAIILYFILYSKPIFSVLLICSSAIIIGSLSIIPLSHIFMNFMILYAIILLCNEIYYSEKDKFFIMLCAAVNFFFPIFLSYSLFSKTFYLNIQFMPLIVQTTLTTFLIFFILPFLHKLKQWS